MEKKLIVDQHQEVILQHLIVKEHIQSVHIQAVQDIKTVGQERVIHQFKK